MKSTIPNIQVMAEFDLRYLLPGQKLVVQTHGGVEMTVHLPRSATTVVISDGRVCMSEVSVLQSILDRQTRYAFPSRTIKLGESWQYGDCFHSHAVTSIILHPTVDPFVGLFM